MTNNNYVQTDVYRNLRCLPLPYRYHPGCSVQVKDGAGCYHGDGSPDSCWAAEVGGQQLLQDILLLQADRLLTGCYLLNLQTKLDENLNRSEVQTLDKQRGAGPLPSALVKVYIKRFLGQPPGAGTHQTAVQP